MFVNITYIQSDSRKHDQKLKINYAKANIEVTANVVVLINNL